MKNEAVRMMLAISAIALTALLTSPDARWSQNDKIVASQATKSVKLVDSNQKETQPEKRFEKKTRSSRSLAFLFRR